VLLHAWGLGGADERVGVWLIHHRAPTWTDASLIGSIMAGGVVLPVLAGTIMVVCLALRKWRIAAFVVFVLAVESASYRATTLVVHRDRPSVPRLEHLPVNESYPSGHTAAAIAVYGGLVLLLTSWSRTASSECSPAIAVQYRHSSPSRACIAECHPLDVAAVCSWGLHP
jgi:undecaprenyl-diphosphatase